jgi:amino acid transporter
MTKKDIGLWSAISIGVGGMVGAGIFSILGTACQIGGNAVYISFIIAGVVALFSTYSYAKLGAKYPSAGGPVEFLVQSFGNGIISGGFNILLWIGYIIALSLYARAFAAYAMTFFSNAPSFLLNILATLIILIFVGIDFVGAKAVGKSELFIVAIKVGILVLFMVAGLFFIKPALLDVSKFPPLTNIFFASAIVFLAYEGFGLITNAAEDMQDPKKTLPRALYLSVLIVIAIYVGVSLVVVGNLPLPEIVKAKDYALAEAAKPFLGLWGFKIIGIAALFSTASAINATLYGGANVSYMIAKDGELPKIFERKIWQKGTEGLFITAGLVILFANLFDLSSIAMLGSAAFLIIYAGVNIGHLKLHKQTNGKLILIWLAILGNIVSLSILIYYLYQHLTSTLIALVVLIVFSFFAEWIYSRITKRELKLRVQN